MYPNPPIPLPLPLPPKISKDSYVINISERDKELVDIGGYLIDFSSRS